jgi:hypothetical protein
MTTPGPPCLTPFAFRVRLLFIIGLGVVGAGVLFCVRPIAQDPTYHHFVDQRPLLGVPHGLNVLSNLPYVAVGVLGLWFLTRPEAKRPGGPLLEPGERCAFALLFIGVALTGFGSAYYHLDPTTERLLWDRLPMAIAFMSLFAIVIAERISLEVGMALLLPLAAVGIGSVVYWAVGEAHGRGDLRLYALVQFYPLVAIPLMLLLFPAKFTRTADLLVALGWYVVAKGCEWLDGPLYRLTGEVVSGHTLKHLASAAGTYWVYRMLRLRRPIEIPQGGDSWQH